MTNYGRTTARAKTRTEFLKRLRAGDVYGKDFFHMSKNEVHAVHGIMQGKDHTGHKNTQRRLIQQSEHFHYPPNYRKGSYRIVGDEK